jgi:hypothetical protein
MKEGSMDLINGDPIQTTNYFDESIDIHHIFPRHYCEKKKYEKKYWNSIINKAPLTARTNRILSGKAPSNYIERLINSHKVDSFALDNHLQSHLIDPFLLKSDHFNEFVVDRATKLLNMIEKAMGKSVQGRDSEETVKQFGSELT